MESTDGQSWSNYIGPKRDNPQVCLTRPVFTPFPQKVAWSGISLIRTVLHKMTLLAKMNKYLKNDAAIHIYKSMLLLYLDYADVVFHKSNSGLFEILQRRICLGTKRNFTSRKAYKLTVTPFLEDRRVAHTQNLVSKENKETPPVKQGFYVLKRNVGFNGAVE